MEFEAVRALAKLALLSFAVLDPSWHWFDFIDRRRQENEVCSVEQSLDDSSFFWSVSPDGPLGDKNNQPHM